MPDYPSTESYESERRRYLASQERRRQEEILAAKHREANRSMTLGDVGGFLRSLFTSQAPDTPTQPATNPSPRPYDPSSPYTSGTGSLEEDRRRLKAHQQWKRQEQARAALYQQQNAPTTLGDILRFLTGGSQ